MISTAPRISYVSQSGDAAARRHHHDRHPPGVGTGMKPPQFLNAGDVVTLGIDGLGEQRQEIVAA